MTGEIEKKPFKAGKAKQNSNLKQMKIKFTPNDEKSKQKKDSIDLASVNRTRSLSIDSSSEDEPLSKIVKLNETKLNDLNDKNLVLKYNKNSNSILEKNKLETISISDDDETSLSVVKKNIEALKSSDSTVLQTTPKKELVDKPVARHSPRIVRIEHEKQKKKINEYNERKMQEEKRIMNSIKERESKLEKELQKMKWEQMKNFSMQNEESKRTIMQNPSMFSKLPPIVTHSTINSAPLIPTPTPKNVVIAIDMDPEKWKKLAPFEQARIIEEKRKLINKNMHQINIKTVNIAPKANAVHSLLHPQKISNLPKTTYQLLSPSSIETIKSPVKVFQSSTSGVIIPKTDCLQKVTFQPAASNISLQTYNQEFSHIFAQKKDDEELVNLVALPRPKSVQMPPGFTSKNFGDIVMIVEFVNCFKKFFDDKDRPDITTAQLLLALTPGSKGSLVTCQILLLFLKVVLGNEDYKIKGLKIELADLPLTEHTVSYLLAQFLKAQLEKMKKERRAKEIESENALVAEIAGFKGISTADKDLDEYKDGDEDDNTEKDPTFVLDEKDPTFILDDDEMEIFKARKKKIKTAKSPFENEIMMISTELEKSEFYDLSTNSQLQILTYLLTIVLDSEELSQFYEDLANEKHEAFRLQDAHRKEVCRQRKEREKDIESSVGSIDKFTSKVASEDADKIKDNEDTRDMPIDSESNKDITNPYHGKTKRQIDALKAEANLSLQKKKDLERKQVEEREDADKMNASIEQQNIKRVLEISHQCKKVLRLEPLGYDRHFRIYWLFTGGTPGLYINGAEVQSINGTVCGPDCWVYYDNMADIDNLISSLTIRGHRESKLKANLRYNYAKIKESVSLLEKSLKRTQEGIKNATFKENCSNNPVLLTELDDSNLHCNSDAIAVENPEAKQQDEQVEEQELEENKKNEINMNNKNSVIQKSEIDNDSVIQKSEINSSVHINDNKIFKEKSNIESKISSHSCDELHPIQEKAINGLTVMNNTQSSTCRNSNEFSNSIKEKTVEEDAHLASIKSLKEDVAEAARKIVAGSLGDLNEPDLTEWIGKLAAAKELQEIKEYILKIHTTVYPRFWNHFMASNTQSNNFVDEWVKAVESAVTLSKLHTLFGVFENSVNWDKSSENSHCKVCCRGKGRYPKDCLIICDGCSLAYHFVCIEPPLREVPQGTWECPECTSTSQSEISNGKLAERLKTTGSVRSESSNEDSDHEDICHVCETDGLVILCDTCPLSYHFDCHNPPLRHAPRGPWSCYECRKVSKTSSVSRRAQSKYIESDSEQGYGKKSQLIKRKKRKSDTSESDLPSTKTKKKSSSSKKFKKIKIKNQTNTKSNKKSTDILISKKRRVYDNEKETSENDFEINDIHKSTDCNGFKSSTKLGNRRPHYAKDENKKHIIQQTIDTSNFLEFKINGGIQRSSRSRRKNSRNNHKELNQEIQACENILCELLKSKDSWPFIYPVNLNEAPDYLDIIKTPITFSVMRKKLEGFEYEDVHQFIQDVKLIFENSKTYNHDTSEVGSAGIRLMSIFDSLVKRYLPELQVS